MKIHPSILSADFANLEAELATISGADAAHLDVMDNHFVPNLTFGLPIVSRLFAVSKLPLDVHLMIEDPDRWAPSFAEVGCDSVTFHLEAAKDPIGLARRIRDIGSKAAIAIKPNTPFSEVEQLLGEIDMLLVMTVEPGFGGQKLIPETVSKVVAAKAALRANGLSVAIQVDGGVTESNIAQLADAGADVFVAGSAVFNAENRNLEIVKLRELAHSH
ncbi:MAG: ribulose-phosphate 3-epimerase [Actinomycetota bacterium]|nr:ribulose-phosphate 3-epimerase [Actinomycetota bacterium]